MSYLEHDSLDHGNEIKRRIIRRMVSMIELTEASLRRLQPLVVLIDDETTGSRFIGITSRRRIPDRIDFTTISQISKTESLSNIGEYLLDKIPNAVMLTDKKLAFELKRDSVVWFDDKNYFLLGIKGKILEVLVPEEK